MMSLTLYVSAILLLANFRVQAVQQQTLALDPYPNKPRLTFNSNGTFKITVFSDQHFGENPWDSWGPEQDANSTRLMKRVLPEEKPDYVVLNGDLITGENTFKENATSLIDEIVAPLNELKIPFSTTQGNHDNQANITHLAEILREQQVSEYSYTRVAPDGVGGGKEAGPGNYWVPIYANSSSQTPSLILWFFDSRGGFSPGPNSTAVADWVDDSVAGWIENEVAAMDEAWGAEGRAALAFVHIPPHVVQTLQENLDSSKDPGLNDDILGEGSTQASGDGEAGKDEAFWNAVTGKVKNLKALISGHDHGNEWCARELSKNVVFCFDKHGGYGGYTSDGWGYGVRNVLFTSPSPDAPVESWIRMEEGEEKARVVLDEV